jgi:hypothetical protein
MSNVAVMPARQRTTQPYLGPSEVCRVEPHQVEIRLPSSELAWARLALAFCYAPVVGDEVLVIGNPDGHYVIGVLRGQGQARLTFPGDVELRSLDGVVRVVGGRGVEIDAPEVALRAGKILTVARSLVQQLGTLYQSVSELWSVRAGASHTVVEDSSYTQAKRATLVTEDELNLNGKAINLG